MEFGWLPTPWNTSTTALYQTQKSKAMWVCMISKPLNDRILELNCFYIKEKITMLLQIVTTECNASSNKKITVDYFDSITKNLCRDLTERTRYFTVSYSQMNVKINPFEHCKH